MLFTSKDSGGIVVSSSSPTSTSSSTSPTSEAEACRAAIPDRKSLPAQSNSYFPAEPLSRDDYAGWKEGNKRARKVPVRSGKNVHIISVTARFPTN